MKKPSLLVVATIVVTLPSTSCSCSKDNNSLEVSNDSLSNTQSTSENQKNDSFILESRITI